VSKRKNAPSQQRVPYDRLRCLNPALDIDFDRSDSMPLIITSSWSQPAELIDLANTLRQRNKLHEVESYEEALAWVRCGIGVAAATEVFSLRKLVTVFALQTSSGNPYARWIGACYNFKLGLSDEACRILAFVSAYVQSFSDELRNGVTPAFNDAKYQDFCQTFASNEQDWRKDFPEDPQAAEQRKRIIAD
jgi:hypothetical protein